MSLSFSMPEGAIDLSGDSAVEGQKKDDLNQGANVQEMALAGVSTFDIGDADLDLGFRVREKYFEDLLVSPDLRVNDIDVISMQQGNVASEVTAMELMELASTTSDTLGRNDTLELATDRLLQARSGSREVELSTEHREAGWDVYDPDSEHGIWQVGHRHDQDGIDSDYRATINGLAMSMSEHGVDWAELNKALGPMGNLDEMRDALQGLNEIAGNRLGFTGFGAFFQALDSQLFSMQQQDDPKGEHRPALGTPEPEVTPPVYALNTPQNDPNGPNQNPGMTPGAPNMRA